MKAGSVRGAPQYSRTCEAVPRLRLCRGCPGYKLSPGVSGRVFPDETGIRIRGLGNQGDLPFGWVSSNPLRARIEQRQRKERMALPSCLADWAATSPSPALKLGFAPVVPSVLWDT